MIYLLESFTEEGTVLAEHPEHSSQEEGQPIIGGDGLVGPLLANVLGPSVNQPKLSSLAHGGVHVLVWVRGTTKGKQPVCRMWHC